MRWVAALAAGACTAVALFAAFYGVQSFFDWQSGRAELLARIAVLESNPGAPNRDGNLAAARHLMELTNGVAVEKVGLSALALVVAVIALTAAWRYAAGSLSRGRLVLTVMAGAVIPAVIAAIMVMLLGLGAIRG